MNDRAFSIAICIVAMVTIAGCQKSSGPMSAELQSPDQSWNLSGIHPWKISNEIQGQALSAGMAPSLQAAGARLVQFNHRGQKRSLVVHFPYGIHAKKSLPCVLVPPGGSNLVTGQRPSPNRDLVRAYLSQGMVAISYELNGFLIPADAQDEDKFAEAYRHFVNAKAGLLNSLNAFEYAISQIDLVDPQQVFIAGHSSGGTHALLFAAHEPRLAGCLAYCPDCDLADFDVATVKYFGRFLPGLDAFVQKASPLTHVENIKCPTFVFAAEDDKIVAFANTVSFVKRLRQANTDVVFRWVNSGGHSDSYKVSGLKQGAKWIVQISERRR